MRPKLQANTEYKITKYFIVEGGHYEEIINCIVREVEYIGSSDRIGLIIFDQIIDLEKHLNLGFIQDNVIRRKEEYFRFDKSRRGLKNQF